MIKTAYDSITLLTPWCRKLFACFTLYLSLIYMPLAYSNDEPLPPIPDQPPLQSDDPSSLNVGMGIGLFPDFVGAKDYSFVPLPHISVDNVMGFSFRFPELTYELYSTQEQGKRHYTKISPIIGLAAGRNEESGVGLFGGDGSPFLKGLGQVKTGVNLGVNLEAGLGYVVAYGKVKTEVASGHGGTVVELGLRSYYPATKATSVIPHVKLTWASKGYHQNFLGITETQAARSIYQPFNIGAGLSDIGAGLMMIYNINNRWSLIGYGSYSRLINRTKDSPLVKGDGGSANQFLSFLVLNYRFEL